MTGIVSKLSKHIALFAALTLGATFGSSAISGPFSPVAYVNDEVVSQYELDQRIALIGILAGGISRANALEALVEERLKQGAAARAGVSVSDADLEAAIAEFAARGGLEPDQLIATLAEQGIPVQTLRDYVAPQILWRDFASARFASRAQVSEDEIDRALAINGPSGGLRVLMAEIFLPSRTPEELENSREIAKTFTENTSFQAFRDAVRRYSVAPSALKDGRLDWISVNDLPPALRGQVLAMKPGDVTAPLSTENAVGFFQLLDVAEIAGRAAPADAIEYAAMYLEGGRSEKTLARAADIAANIDTCDDLYGVNAGGPEAALEIGTLPVADIPRDVALELAKLDPNEISTALTRSNDQTLVFLMLCGRSYAAGEDIDRGAVRQQLRAARLSSAADSYLAELEAAAFIQYP